jgi:hypothetical protein
MPTSLYFLLWGALISCLLFFATEREFWEALRRRWLPLGLILCVALVWRLPFEGHFFYGLEYEDSYIYSVAARSLNSGTRNCAREGSCYLTSVCAVGNWNSCKVTETSSGHFVGYPFLIAMVSRVLGYRPAVASYLSLMASMMTVVFVFLFGRLIAGDIAGLAGSVIFGLTPVFAVQGVGTYAEPVSNMLVVVCLLLCVRLFSSNAETSLRALVINWVALTFTAVLAIAVKRENVLLVPVAVFIGLIFNLERGPYGRARIVKVLGLGLVSAGVCVWFAAVQLRLVTVVRKEMVEYATFPFSLAVMRTMLPLFLRSYVSLSWYLGSSILVAVGLIAAVRTRRGGMYAMCVFIAYLLLYSSHVRSYYQLESGSVGQFDTLRYSMNLAGLWSILAGLGFACCASIVAKRPFGTWFQRWSGGMVWVLVGVYALSSWVLTSRWKEDMVSTELAVRIEPTESALEIVDDLGTHNTFVITLEPLLVHMLCRQPVNVIGFPYLTRPLVQDLLRDNPHAAFLYVEQAIYSSPADRKRYRAAFDFIDGVHKTRLYAGNNYGIYRIDWSEDQHPQPR